MKSLDDIKADMSALYESVRTGATDLRVASELANIAGKYLKAEQLSFAKEVFLDSRNRRSVGASTPAMLTGETAETGGNQGAE